MWLILAIAVAGVILVAVSAQIIVWRVQRYRLMRFLNETVDGENNLELVKESEFLMKPKPKSKSNFLNDLLENYKFENKKIIQRRDFQIGDEIGSGFFGNVFRGQFKNSVFLCFFSETTEEVAIKVNSMWDNLGVLFDECKILQLIPPHPNVLKFVGVCIDQVKSRGKLHLLTEFCENGSLLDYGIASEISFPHWVMSKKV